MYDVILANVHLKDERAIMTQIMAEKELSFIREITEDDRQYGRNFSRDTRNAIYLRQAMAKELTCDICHARIRAKTITLDHKDRKEDGGLGTPDNGQLAHPYCNDGYKEKLAHTARLGP